MTSAGDVSLSQLVGAVASAEQAALVALAQQLGGQPEEARRRLLLRAAHALRQRVLRLLVLVRCALVAGRTQQLQLLARAREALAARDATFGDAAGRLAVAHAATGGEPLADVPGALRVLAAGRCGAAEGLLPAASALPRPLAPPCPSSARLDAAVRAQLLEAARPAQLHVVGVAAGVATLRSPTLYEADLSLAPATPAAAGEAVPLRRGGWALLRVRLLVRDADNDAPRALAAPQAASLCAALGARMAASPRPLVCLHAVLSELAALTARELAARQARALEGGRWGGAVRLAAATGAQEPGAFVLQLWPSAAGPGRSITLGLSAAPDRRLCCTHEPPLPGGGPQLCCDALSVEALLAAAVAAAAREQLAACAAALRHDARTALLAPPGALRDGVAGPALALCLPGGGAVRPSLRCDWRSGALRVAGAGPLLSDALSRELQAAAPGAPAAAAAVSVAVALWREAVRAQVVFAAKAVGMRPLALPKSEASLALQLPGPAAPRLLITLGPEAVPATSMWSASHAGQTVRLGTPTAGDWPQALKAASDTTIQIFFGIGGHL